METMPLNEHMMDYLTAYLIYEMSKRKENEPKCKDAALVLQQVKGDISFMHQDVKSCYYCGKLGQIERFVIKQRTRIENKQIMTTNIIDSSAS